MSPDVRTNPPGQGPLKDLLLPPAAGLPGRRLDLPNFVCSESVGRSARQRPRKGEQAPGHETKSPGTLTTSHACVYEVSGWAHLGRLPQIRDNTKADSGNASVLPAALSREGEGLHSWWQCPSWENSSTNEAMHVSIRGSLSLESPALYNNASHPIWRADTAGFPCHVVAGDTPPTVLDDE